MVPKTSPSDRTRSVPYAGPVSLRRWRLPFHTGCSRNREIVIRSRRLVPPLRVPFFGRKDRVKPPALRPTIVHAQTEGYAACCVTGGKAYGSDPSGRRLRAASLAGYMTNKSWAIGETHRWPGGWLEWQADIGRREPCVGARRFGGNGGVVRKGRGGAR